MTQAAEQISDIGLARMRLKRVADGKTLQAAYGVENSYEPIGDDLRADLRAVLLAAPIASLSSKDETI